MPGMVINPITLIIFKMLEDAAWTASMATACEASHLVAP